MLNHIAATWLRDRFGSSTGLPIRCGRSLFVPSRFTSRPAVTVNGLPLRATAIAETVQPLARALIKRLPCWT